MMMQGLAIGGAEKRIKYGYLYNWYTTQGTVNASIIPTAMEALGWSIPTIPNFTTLRNYNGGSDATTGGWLKTIGTTYWNSPNTGASNIYKFSAVGSGVRNQAGGFAYLKDQGNFWTISDFDTTRAYLYLIDAGTADFYPSPINKLYGSCIRLVRPATPQDPPNDDDYCEKYIGNDGTKYLTVRIGNQVWTAENLAETKYRNGDSIPNVTDNTAWAALTSGARCAYGNNESNVFI